MQIKLTANTIIHPEEILADNFVSLVMQDRAAPAPEILQRLPDVLGEKAENVSGTNPYP